MARTATRKVASPCELHALLQPKTEQYLPNSGPSRQRFLKNRSSATSSGRIRHRPQPRRHLPPKNFRFRILWTSGSTCQPDPPFRRRSAPPIALPSAVPRSPGAWGSPAAPPLPASLHFGRPAASARSRSLPPTVRHTQASRSAPSEPPAPATPRRTGQTLAEDARYVNYLLKVPLRAPGSHATHCHYGRFFRTSFLKPRK